MRPALIRSIAWGGFVLLLLLHLDWWRPARARLWFGWMPEELLWRLAWMALATGYLFFFCTWVWAEDDGVEEGDNIEEGDDS